MISILNVITFRHIGQILFENKPDISHTSFNEEEKQSVKTSKAKTLTKKEKVESKYLCQKKC